MKIGKKELSLKVLLLIVIPIIIVIAAVISFFVWYNNGIKSVNKSEEIIVLKIEDGTGAYSVVKLLAERGLIKNEKAFKVYMKLNNVGGFQAGRYGFSGNMSVEQIVDILVNGKVYTGGEITITFLEGKTMRWMAEKIANNTSNTKEEVFELLENEEYIDSLIEKYWFLTDEIKNPEIYYSLEGYLFPDTYNFVNEDVTVAEIFEVLLNQTNKVLTPHKEEIENSKYSVHEILTMASVVETEGISNNDRKDIASTLYNRLENGMSLGSDVTTYYACKLEIGERDLYVSELNKDNGYNTRGPNMAGKLPVGPIASSSAASIEAAIEPSNTSYLYFVADKNGKVYFTRTNAEHENKVSELKNSGLWYEF